MGRQDRLRRSGWAEGEGQALSAALPEAWPPCLFPFFPSQPRAHRQQTARVSTCEPPRPPLHPTQQTSSPAPLPLAAVCSSFTAPARNRLPETERAGATHLKLQELHHMSAIYPSYPRESPPASWCQAIHAVLALGRDRCRPALFGGWLLRKATHKWECRRPPCFSP